MSSPRKNDNHELGDNIQVSGVKWQHVKYQVSDISVKYQMSGVK